MKMSRTRKMCVAIENHLLEGLPNHIKKINRLMNNY